MEKLVMFKKWRDPMIPIEDYAEAYPEKENNFKNLNLIKKIASEDYDVSPYNGPIYVSNGGLIPINEHNLTGRNFNLWICHTNFKVTQSICEKVDSLDGVEILRVVTPYRFMFGVAQLFDEEDVKSKIEDLLTSSNSVVNELVKQAKTRYKNWVIIKNHVGSYEIVGDSSKEELLKRINQKEIIKKSWD